MEYLVGPPILIYTPITVLMLLLLWLLLLLLLFLPLLSQVHPYCLDALIESHEGTEIILDVKNELTQLLKKGGYRREHRQELRDLRKEVRQREDALTKSILNNADVVLCTCITAKSRLLKGREYRSPMSLAASLASSASSSDGHDPQLQPFNLCIIDEAAQALEVRQ